MANWMLSPFADIFEEIAPESKAPKNPTLKDWYNCSTHFFSLQINKNELIANPLEADDDLEKTMNDLEPRTKLPKYVTNLDIPRFSPDDLKVVTESDELNPFHPSRVMTKDGETYFLKDIDATQPDSTKRIQTGKWTSNKLSQVCHSTRASVPFLYFGTSSGCQIVSRRRGVGRGARQSELRRASIICRGFLGNSH